MFFFNVNGNSGKFMIDKTDGQPVLQQFQDMNIEYKIFAPGTSSLGYGSIGSFIVTDASGIKYYFGVSKDGLRVARNIDEIKKNYRIVNGGVISELPVGNSFFTSWQLMDIETKNGDIIKFEYDDANGNEISNYARRSYDKLEGQNPVNYSSTIRSIQYSLKSISFKSGKLVFVPQSTTRQDLQGARALDRVELYNINNENNPITKYKFHYSYTTSIATTSVLPYLLSLDSFANKRLFLDSIQQEDINQNTLPPYVFDYNNEILPSRFSNSQDLWGYFNAADNGPYLTFFNYRLQNNNRRVDTTSAEAGILKKISYPTGGSTSYTYEHNTVNNSDVLSKVALAGGSNPLISRSEGVSNLESELFIGGRYVKEFQVGTDVSNTDGKYGVWFADSTYCVDDVNVFVPGCAFIVTLQNITTNVFYHLFIGNNRNLTLTPGTYRLTVIPQGSHDPFDFNDGFFVGLNWFEQEVSDSEFIYGAGKRIKRIDFDEGNGVVKTREYEYLEHSGYGTSGKLFGLPNFYSIIESNNNIMAIQGAVGGGGAMSTPQGNSIGYYNVTEYLGSKQNNTGKIEYEFTSFEDTGDYYKFPNPLPNDNEWLRGKPITTKVYENTGQVDANGKFIYVLKKETQNEYLFGGISTPPYLYVPDFYPDHDANNEGKTILSEDITDRQKLYLKNKTLFRFPMVMFTGSPYSSPHEFDSNNPNSYWYKTFYHTAGTFDLLSTVETDYYDDGDLEKKTVYSYNYDNHYQTASILNKNSNNEARIQTFTYPQDIPNTSIAIDSLIAQNRYIPLEVKTYQDKNNDSIADNVEILSTVKTTYNWQDNVLEPVFVETSKDGNSLEKRVVYNKYDNRGNPLEVSKADGVPISYVWGYDEQYPVAKIENATRSQIEAIQGFGSNFHSGNSGLTINQENTLRTSLPNAMVTTYTYDPLIGVTSITDPKGYTVYYEYDNFNRLKSVKDAEGNFVSDYKYHYQGQQ